MLWVFGLMNVCEIEGKDSMIKFVTGNIFDSGADCLINTVNCEGFMGKGIAYQFKMRFPENNCDYVKACKTGTLRIGTARMAIVHSGCIKRHYCIVADFLPHGGGLQGYF